MEFWTVVIGVVILGILLYLVWPKFRDKADKYVDKDSDGKPFR